MRPLTNLIFYSSGRFQLHIRTTRVYSDRSYVPTSYEFIYIFVLFLYIYI